MCQRLHSNNVSENVCGQTNTKTFWRDYPSVCGSQELFSLQLGLSTLVVARRQGSALKKDHRDHHPDVLKILLGIT